MHVHAIYVHICTFPVVKKLIYIHIDTYMYTQRNYSPLHVYELYHSWTRNVYTCTCKHAELPILLFVLIKKFRYLPSLKITLVVLVQLNSLAFINSIILLREKLLERQHNLFGTKRWASHCFTGMSPVKTHTLYTVHDMYECKHIIRTCTCIFLGNNPPAVYKPTYMYMYSIADAPTLVEEPCDAFQPVVRGASMAPAYQKEPSCLVETHETLP